MMKMMQMSNAQLELLRLAALAAGYKVMLIDGGEILGSYLSKIDDPLDWMWDPYSNDWEAFQLMVDLGISVRYGDNGEVEASLDNGRMSVAKSRGGGWNMGDATRAAITGCAVLAGREKEKAEGKSEP
jgi:hypothetical protein